jgi:nicotinamide N-methyltransferase
VFEDTTDADAGTEPAAGFDVLILADLLFRHSEHARLARTITQALRRRGDARAYVFFTSYRPWLRYKDLRFFDVAREAGLVVEHLLEEKMERPMFEDDPGDEEVRRTCSGYAIRWPG